MHYFPAYIHKESNGSASGFFPGVDGCFFAGNTLSDCFEDAKEALDAHLELLAEEGMTIPVATKVEDHEDDEECTNGMWCVIEIDASKYEGEIKRVNITLPEILISKIDKAVSKEGKFDSRSGFIAVATRELLQRI